MPCTACGKGGLNVSSKKPSAMVLGKSIGGRKKNVRRSRGILLNVTKRNKTFLLGSR
jgi:hypothetical protein